MRARTKLIARSFGRRDARLILVATEGARTEPLYFDVLKLNGIIDKSRVVLEVISSKSDNKSAPEHVLERLKKSAETLPLKDMDERWLVIDVDRWGDGKLSKIAKAAIQDGVSLAISNPSFEVWLLLHASPTCPDKQRDIEAELRQAFGSWSKTRIDATQFTEETVREAISRARKLDGPSSERWPKKAPGTHMHRLMATIAPNSSREALHPSPP